MSEEKIFSQQYRVEFANLDFNNHMSSYVYSTKMSDVRMQFFLRNGWSTAFLIKNDLGPVVLKDEYHYLKELHYGEEFTVTFELLGYTEDHRFAKFQQRVFNSDGKLSCYAIILVTFFSIKERKIKALPDEMFETLKDMPRAENFAIFDSSETRSPYVPTKDTL